jgi:hypothetical protein
MVPEISFVPQPVAALPISNGRMFGRQDAQGVLDFTVILYFRFILTGRSGYPYQFTRLSVTKLFIFY